MIKTSPDSQKLSGFFLSVIFSVIASSTGNSNTLIINKIFFEKQIHSLLSNIAGLSATCLPQAGNLFVFSLDKSFPTCYKVVKA